MNSEVLDRTPPQNLEAEKGVLGSILLKPDVLDDIGSRLHPDHFHSEANRRIYRHLVALHDAGTRPDVLILRAKLKESGELEAIGGVAYLAEVSQAAPHAANAAHYADLIIRAAKLRSLINGATTTLQAAYDGRTDPDEILNQAESALTAITTGGTNDPVSMWNAVDQVMKHIDEVQAQRQSAGVMTGLLKFDRIHGGLFPGELIILAARPTVGKSALAMQWAHHSATKGRGVYFASLEMGARELASRIMCSEARVNSKGLRNGNMEDGDRAKLAKVSAEIAPLNLHIHDQPRLTVYDIRRAARRRVKDGLDLLVVDYLQLLAPDEPRDPRNEQLNKMTRQLKLLARELKIPVVVLSQINREGAKDATMANLKGSGGIEEDADVVIILSRQVTGAEEGSNSGEATLQVEKNRNGETGCYKLEWLGSRTRYIGEDEQQPHEEF